MTHAIAIGLLCEWRTRHDACVDNAIFMLRHRKNGIGLCRIPRAQATRELLQKGMGARAEETAGYFLD